MQVPDGHCRADTVENRNRDSLLKKYDWLFCEAEVTGDWLPGVVALPDRGGILIAERQEVEELSEVEEGLHVVLKRMVSNA